MRRRAYIAELAGVEKLFEKLAQSFKVYAPVFSEGVCKFAEVKEFQEVYLGCVNTLLPPKKLFMPVRETLFSFNLATKTITDPEIKEEIALFGVRPCDLKALLILDRVLLGDLEDPFYAARRRGAFIVAMNCVDVGDYCFCTSFDAGPFAADGYDLALTPLGEKFLVEVSSQRGEKLVEEIGFREACAEDLAVKAEILEEVSAKVRKIKEVERIPQLLEDQVESWIWGDLSDHCLACGSCTMVCPTCYCFRVEDKLDLELISGDRVRSWDSCQLVSFSEMALGLNFRRERKSRVRARFYHKYHYFPSEHKLFGCVGCGRCVQWCLSKIDPVEVLERIRGETGE